MKVITHISLIALGLSCLASTAAEAVQGRADIERERQIYKLAKSMEPEQKDVEAFGDLLETLDDCDIDESTRDFWRTARSVKAAMEKELAEISERAARERAAEHTDRVKKTVQRAEMLEGAPTDTTEPPPARTPLQRRAHEMEMIYREAEGLRNPVAMAERSTVERYRLLAGKFHRLMQEDIDAMQVEIEELKGRNSRDR